MQQGAKNTQNTKVDKSIVKASNKAIGNLMDQIGDDDDEDEKNSYESRNKNRYNSNNKNYKIDFNFDNTQEYVPEYSKRKIEENNDKDLNIDIGNYHDNGNDNDVEISSPKNKPKIIKREKKLKKKEESNSNNNSLHLRTGIKRTIKQQEELSSNHTYNNIFSKTIKRERKDIINIESTDTKDNNYTYVSFNKNKYKLPIEKNNSIKIFWYDAIEESFNNKPNVIFFGKIYEPQSNSFLSISIIIKDIYRTVFILPKPEYEDKAQQVYEEFDNLRKKRFSYIKEYQCKFIKKNIVLNYQLIQKKNITF